MDAKKTCMESLRIKHGTRLTLGMLSLVAIPCVLTWLAWRQEERNHALLAAIDRNDTLAAVSLLQQGANANASQETQPQPSFWQRLCAALRLRKSSMPARSPALRRLLEPLPPSADPYDMYYHFRPENMAMVSALLEHGAEMESRSTAFDHQDNALQWAACSGKNGTIRLLVRHGATLNARNNFGSTPLMEAEWNGQEKAVQTLVDLGADLNIRDNQGVSPLRNADRYEMKSISRILRRAGAKR